MRIVGTEYLAQIAEHPSERLSTPYQLGFRASGGKVSPVGKRGGNGPAALGPAVYALGTSEAERARLLRQAQELRVHSEYLLDRVAVGAGQRAIDVGCGPLGIVDLLSKRVGRTGSVIGLDSEPANVELARAFVRDAGLTNVEIVEGDARATGLSPGSFDLVHARTLLVNLRAPQAVLTEMVRLVRPGGWVAVMEPDSGVNLYHPPHPTWQRMHDIFMAGFRVDGADPLIGRRVLELLEQAGLSQIGVEARMDVYPLGNSRRRIRLELIRSMRPKLVAAGIASEAELDDLDRSAGELLDDPHTLVMPILYFLVWGRRQRE